MGLIPPLDVQLQLTAEEPYNFPTNRVYYCRSVEDFERLTADNAEITDYIYNTYYMPQGLAVSIYQQDVSDGAKILTFEEFETGTITYIPSSFLKAYKAVAIVPYDLTSLVIDLGLTPSDMEMEAYKEALVNITKDKLGIVPNGLAVDKQEPVELVNELMHYELNVAREAVMQYPGMPIETVEYWIARYNESQNEVTALRTLIKQMYERLQLLESQ